MTSSFRTAEDGLVACNGCGERKRPDEMKTAKADRRRPEGFTQPCKRCNAEANREYRRRRRGDGFREARRLGRRDALAVLERHVGGSWADCLAEMKAIAEEAT